MRSYWQFFITWIVIHCYHLWCSPEQGLQLTDCGKMDDKSCLLVQCLNRMLSWYERVCWDMSWKNSLLLVAHHRVRHSSGWWVRPRTPCAENWCGCHQSGHLLDTIITCLTQYFQGTISIQYSPCGVCGGPNGTPTSFSLSTSVLPFRYHSTNAPHSFIHLSQALYNFKNCSVTHTHIYIDKYEFPQTWDSDSELWPHTLYSWG